MALFNAPPALASDPNEPVALGRPPEYLGGWLPLVFSAAVALAIMAVFYAVTSPVGNTQIGTSNVNSDSPSLTNTAVVAPMPSPTTEPRPMQAPIQ
jgi:hypothetical protein